MLREGIIGGGGVGSRLDGGFVSEVVLMVGLCRKSLRSSNLRFCVRPVLGVEAVLVVAVK